jgi:hypothetical protein
MPNDEQRTLQRCEGCLEVNIPQRDFSQALKVLTGMDTAETNVMKKTKWKGLRFRSDLW